jgi:acyl carrier protein
MEKTKKVREIIALVLEIDTNQMTEDILIEDVTNWDSLSILRVMTALEEEFSIKIPLHKFLEAKKISDIYSILI